MTNIDLRHNNKDDDLMRKFVAVLDTIVEWSGRVVNILVYLCTLVILNEVILRYVFNRPTTWGNEASTFMFGILCVVGGGYVFLHGGHIVVDVFSGRLSPRKRAILEASLFPLTFLFIVVLIWYGVLSLQYSIAFGEHSQSEWSPPLWPIKLALPTGATLMLFGGLSRFIKDLYVALGKGGI